MMRVTVSLVASFMVGLALAACGGGGTATTCNAATCGGCCDAAGKCQTGDTAAVCGQGGALCAACEGTQTCTNHACTAAPVDAGFVCTRTPVACSDAAAASLDLNKTTVAPGGIVNVADGTAAGAFKSTIDARAGVTGGNLTPTESFVYARFTSTGLEKVEESDVQASDSMNWDIAFRRFYIRLNGGDSGPACASASILPAGTTYESVQSDPGGLNWVKDDFLSDPPSCSFQDDRSGLSTSPATAFAQNDVESYYSYQGCVKMTERVFLVRANSGRLIKATVTGYYASDANQASCNLGTPVAGAAGGSIKLRWAFLN